MLLKHKNFRWSFVFFSFFFIFARFFGFENKFHCVLKKNNYDRKKPLCVFREEFVVFSSVFLLLGTGWICPGGNFAFRFAFYHFFISSCRRGFAFFFIFAIPKKAQYTRQVVCPGMTNWNFDSLWGRPVLERESFLPSWLL